MTANWSDGYVTTNGIKLHYFRTGGNKPQVVFNHGAFDDGLCWTRIVKELEVDYDVIMPDARGHGKSESGNKTYSTEARVADLVGIIQTLKLDHPVVGGHSMGADTSLNLADKFPHLVRAVFLEDPPLILPGESPPGGEQVKPDAMIKMMKRYMTLIKWMPRFIGIRMARKGNPTYPENEIQPWVDAKKRLSTDFINSVSSDLFNSRDPLAAFEKVTVPVLLFIGDREKMSIVSKETAAKAAAVNNKVKVVHLEGASHDIRRTRFDGYLPALTKFLSESHNP